MASSGWAGSLLLAAAVVAAVMAAGAAFSVQETCYVQFPSGRGPARGPKDVQFQQVAESVGVAEKQGSLNTVPNCLFGEMMTVTREERNELRRLVLFSDNYPEDKRLDYEAVIGTDAVQDGGGSCLTERNSGGVAVGDFNNDGWDDLAVTRLHAPLLIYQNMGNGSFVDVTKSTGVLDELIGAVLQSGCKFKTKGKKVPPRQRCRVGTEAAYWVDVDNDGDVDLYVTSMGGKRHYLFINTNGMFKEEAVQRGAQVATLDDPSNIAGSSVGIGDYDRDGYLDLFVAEYRPFLLRDLKDPYKGHFSNTRLLRNKGAAAPGHFEDVTEAAGFDVVDISTRKLEKLHMGRRRTQTRIPTGVYAFAPVWSDLDNDGWLDLFLTADFSTAMLFWNNQNGTFTEGSVAAGTHLDENAMGVSLADIVDESCTFSIWGNRMYHNDGNRTFSDWTLKLGVREANWAWGTGFMDLDNDGDLDLYAVNGYEMPEVTFDDHWNLTPNNLWINPGTNDEPWHHLTPFYGLNGMKAGRGLAYLDYDHDGDVDIFVANFADTPYFFLNRLDPASYLRVRVLEAPNGRDSYQARVYLGNNMREIGTGTGFQGQSEAIAHFGLGAGTVRVTDTLRVMWPGSRQQVIVHNAPINSLITIVRPSADQTVVVMDALPKCAGGEELFPKPAQRPITGETFGRVRDEEIDNFVLGATDDSAMAEPGIVESNPIAPALLAVLEAEALVDSVPEPSIDGKANHNGLGATNTWLRRVTNVSYPDGIDRPMDTHEGRTMPGPRFISNLIGAQTGDVFSTAGLSDCHSHFGQLLAHDTDHTPNEGNPHFASKLSMLVPKGDPVFDPEGTGEVLMRFRRSVFDRTTGQNQTVPRRQQNRVTSFIDASVVYGSTPERAAGVRAGAGGKLLHGDSGHLPFNTGGMNNDNPLARPIQKLFLAGDVRVNIQMGLMAMHALFVREHNFIAEELGVLLDATGALADLTAKQADELIFRHARRIVVAEMQAITFNEYLPALLGPAWMHEHFPAYSGYKQTVDPSVAIEFSTAAFRFGHSQAGQQFLLVNEDGSTNTTLPLKSTYFHPDIMMQHGGIDAVLRGMVNIPSQQIDIQVADDLRNFLFGPVDEGGVDLLATNIMRGRDHGIPPLNTVRVAFGLQPYSAYSQITANSTLADALASLYLSIDDVDLFVGGLCEDHIAGGAIGETFAVILTEQFLRLRDGDKFWYQNVYSEDVAALFDQITLGSLIRRNVAGNYPLQHNVFFVPEPQQPSDS